ncbi:MAG: hypothetical protein H9Q66_03440 [Spiroplasma ixodetis]|nr:hypothetical protein [Spiroplasma ixodetis]
MLPKKDSPIVSFNDIKEQCDLEFLPILENNFDELEQSKESDSSRNLSSTSLTSSY